MAHDVDRRPRDRPHRHVCRGPGPGPTAGPTGGGGAPGRAPREPHPAHRRAARRRCRCRPARTSPSRSTPPARPSARGRARRWSCASGSSCATTTSCSSGRSSCSTSSSWSRARPAARRSRRSPTSRSWRGTTPAPPRHTCGPRRRAGLFPVLTQSTVHHHARGVVGIVSPWNYPLVAGDHRRHPGADGRQRRRAAPRPAGVADRPAGGAAARPRPGCPSRCCRSSSATGRRSGRRSSTSPTTSATPARPTPGAGSPTSVAGRLVGYSPRARRQELDVRRRRRGPRQGGRGCGAGLLLVGRAAVHLDRAAARARRRGRRVHPAVRRPRSRQMRLGAELAYGTDMGSLVSAQQLERVAAHVDDARSKGARVLTGGRARPDIGPLLLRAHRPRGRDRRDGPARRRDVRPGRRRSTACTATRRRSGWPTTPTTASTPRVCTRDVAPWPPDRDRHPGRHRQRQRGVCRRVGQRRRPDGRDEAVRASVAGTAARASSSTPSRRTSPRSTSCPSRPSPG